MNSYFVSIIIPYYNQEKYIFETLKSLLTQTYKNFEVIIVDDGSHKSILDELDRFKVIVPFQIKYFRQSNKGLSAARNAGIKLASGDYFQFLDADDLIENDKIETQIGIFKNNNDIDIVYSGFKFLKGNNIFDPGFKLHHTNQFVLDDLLERNIMVVHSALVKSKEIKKYQFDINLKSLEDWDYWIRLAILGYKFKFDKNDFAIYRRHDSNMSKNILPMLDAYVQLVCKHKKNGYKITSEYYIQLISSFKKTYNIKTDFIKYILVFMKRVRYKICE